MSAPSPNPLPEEKFNDIERLLNNTIHELVFILQFLDHDDFESAQDALRIAQGNLERVEGNIAAHVEDAEDAA